MLFGVLLHVLGMIAFSIYTVFGKKTAQRLGSSAMTSFTDIFGALAVLPILLIQGVHPFQFELQPIWGQMLYMCIGNTGIAFYLYFKALESLDTSVGAMSFLLKPFIGSIIAAIFFR
ncbi:EamA family transporter [Niallia taxi]